MERRGGEGTSGGQGSDVAYSVVEGSVVCTCMVQLYVMAVVGL